MTSQRTRRRALILAAVVILGASVCTYAYCSSDAPTDSDSCRVGCAVLNRVYSPMYEETSHTPTQLIEPQTVESAQVCEPTDETAAEETTSAQTTSAETIAENTSAESDNAHIVDTQPVTTHEVTYTEDDLFCMAAAIYNEAGGDDCSDDTRRLVGYVILNRVNDVRFPSSIRDVLEQYRQYGTFYITGVKFADRHTLPQEKHAVDRAYRIAEEVLRCESVPIPHTVVFQAEFEQGASLYKYQDGTYFCHATEVK